MQDRQSVCHTLQTAFNKGQRTRKYEGVIIQWNEQCTEGILIPANENDFPSIQRYFESDVYEIAGPALRNNGHSEVKIFVAKNPTQTHYVLKLKY